MKNIKEWAERIENDEEFAKKFEGIEDSKEMLDLAKKEGYEFTEEELMDLRMEAVSGGVGLGLVTTLCKVLGPVQKGFSDIMIKVLQA